MATLDRTPTLVPRDRANCCARHAELLGEALLYRASGNSAPNICDISGRQASVRVGFARTHTMPTFRVHICDVGRLRTGEQVSGPDTQWRIAMMEHPVPIKYGTVGELPRDSMGVQHPHSRRVTDLSVAPC